jgi:hypothetical protein
MSALSLILLLAAPPAALQFSDLLEPWGPLRPSAKVLSLEGKRVRIEGFMARMEVPPRGAF